MKKQTDLENLAALSARARNKLVLARRNYQAAVRAANKAKEELRRAQGEFTAAHGAYEKAVEDPL